MKQSAILIILMCCLSGCARYYRWGSAQFGQVGYRAVHFEDLDPYVQSVDQYDGFATVGHFDLLWYSRPVMEWYLEQYGERTGCSQGEVYTTIRSELLKEQQEYIVIYILMSYDGTSSLIPQLSIDEDNIATWSATLSIDGSVHKPVDIKKIIRVVPELAQCFGRRYDPHYRTLYRVRFARSAQGLDDLLALPSTQADTQESMQEPRQACNLCLVLRSAQYAVSASWRPECLERHRLREEQLQ